MNFPREVYFSEVDLFLRGLFLLGVPRPRPWSIELEIAHSVFLNQLQLH